MVTDNAHWTAVAETAVHKHNAVQKVSELAQLLTLLDKEIKPRVVLEVGSDLGGSLYAWSCLPSVERVYAVTLPPPDGYTADYHGADVVLGDSHQRETVDRLLDRLENRSVDFLFIDGDHSAAGVRRDLHAFLSLVRREGGLVVLHDIVVHPQFPDCRVHEVWAELQTYRPTSQFEIMHEPSTWGGFGMIRW